jgi:hypothetical protein
VSRNSVGLADIEQIFTVLERLDISREAVVIPLKPGHPGAVRILAEGKNKGKLEIVVESEGTVEGWLPELERTIRTVMQLD